MPGKLKNCPRCGRLFMDMGRKICEACYEKELQDEEKAAEYVRKHPDAHIKEIVEGTGVKEKIVMRMVREGRFVATAGVEISYPCERCGKPIINGRFCDACNKAIITEVKQHQKQQERLMSIRKESSQIVAKREAPKQDREKVDFAKKKPAERNSRGGMYTKNMVIK